MMLYNSHTHVQDAERKLVLNFYIDDMSGSEIALATGIPLGIINARLSKARTKLLKISIP